MTKIINGMPALEKLPGDASYKQVGPPSVRTLADLQAQNQRMWGTGRDAALPPGPAGAQSTQPPKVPASQTTSPEEEQGEMAAADEDMGGSAGHLGNMGTVGTEAPGQGLPGGNTDEHESFGERKAELAHKPGVTNPGGLAAYIGREKYGKAGMEKKAEAGKK